MSRHLNPVMFPLAFVVMECHRASRGGVRYDPQSYLDFALLGTRMDLDRSKRGIPAAFEPAWSRPAKSSIPDGVLL